jgi:hypothetical protein
VLPRASRLLPTVPLVLAALATAPLRAQTAAGELEPQERLALTARANADPAAAVAALLELARDRAAAAGDAAHHARIEAWATNAARLARTTANAAALDGLDALRTSAAAVADPLLADRVALAALELAETLPRLDHQQRAQQLGFVERPWLLGPFANERGSGFAQPLPPETALDLDAELAGKRRAVRWRQLPARQAHGPALPLARIVHPHEQSLVYLAFALVAEQPATVVLELGTTGAWAVFVGGAKVAARDVERPFGHDQDAVALPLRAGANLVVWKCCHQEGAEFTVAARVRASGGGPAAGVRVATDADTVRAAAAAAAAARPDANTPAAPAAATTAIALGGRSTWTIGDTSGADALRLAWLWSARDADGDRDRRDTAAAHAATKALPDVAECWLVLASTLVRHARSAADRDENERRRVLEQALRVFPGHAEAACQLGFLLRDRSNLWREARALADGVLAAHPRSLPARWLRLTTLRDEGLTELADAETVAAAATATRPDLWRAAATVLADRDPARALELRRRVCDATAADGDWTALATAHARVGDAEAAFALLRGRIGLEPLSARAHRQLAELQFATGDAAAAAATLDRWLELAPDDADAMIAAARYWRARRGADPLAHERQLELLRRALAIEPNRRDDERLAEHVARELRGDERADTAFHVPWQVDAAALVKGDPGPPADAAEARDPLHWLLRQQVVRANANGTTNVYTHDVVRVLSPDGARGLATWSLRAYRGEQRARLLACTVFRADGTVRRPALQGATVRLPDLRPGDVVAVEGRVDDLAPSFFGDYFGLVHVFAGPDGSPARTDDLVVIAAPGREYHCQQAHGAPEPQRETLADGTLRLRWTMRDLPRDQPEIRRPTRLERDPVVRVSTYRDWDQFASWWWNLIKNQIETTPAMRATVARLTAGLATTEQKIAAIYHFVTTDVRYEAWEFGVHGYKPYSTALVHERRHGDCKDKALLLTALLGEIGVPCRPVLIFADPLRSKDDLALPLVQHFNHCIAWLPPHDGRPGRFLDGTATWHPTDTLPDMDQGADVLIVDAGRAELRTVPWTTPQQNLDALERTIELAADGSASVAQVQRPLGNAAVELRSTLATEPARLREVVERELVATFGRASLRDLEPSPTTDPEAPVTLRATASLPAIGQRTAQAWQLPSALERGDLLMLTADTERTTPLLLGAPHGTSRTVRYLLPPGWRAGELPADVARDAPFGTFRMRWRRDGTAVVVERELALSSPRIAPEQYAAFRDFVGAMKAADGQLVLLQPENSR